MPLARPLLDTLVCPKSKQPLVYFEQEGFLLCPASRLRYRIDDGVPVLLVDEATEVTPAEVDRLVKQAKELGLPGA
ncbi:MAG TPA: Trm112 family protein [Kofleriaceae bacterium]